LPFSIGARGEEVWFPEVVDVFAAFCAEFYEGFDFFCAVLCWREGSLVVSVFYSFAPCLTVFAGVMFRLFFVY